MDEESLRGRLTTASLVSFELARKGEERDSFGLNAGCEIRGFVINDLNLDGRRTDADALLGAGVAQAVGPGGIFRAPVGAQGTFSIPVSKCGEYAVSLDPASLPELMNVDGEIEEVRVKAMPAEIPSVELLAAAIRTVQGDVYLDRNGNGRRDDGEPIVPMATVVAGERRAVADETGSFFLRRLPAGANKLRVDPDTLPADLKAGPPVTVVLPNAPSAIEGVHVGVRPAR